MIDYLALALIHGLLVIGFFRIVQNDALDPAVKLPKRRKPAPIADEASSGGPLDNQKSDAA